MVPVYCRIAEVKAARHLSTCASKRLLGLKSNMRSKNQDNILILGELQKDTHTHTHTQQQSSHFSAVGEYAKGWEMNEFGGHHEGG